ncbi:MAG: protein TolR [Alphaproteobacteria bacterium RIFOXYD12_FULL_60_8]|nr:MAG: protein TolR [Alphaproteobacteria bacterium RIFOXYD12_FULL_60_8]
MGFVVNQAGQGGNHRPAMRPMSDINVTPMVDVMLVLLVIFMVTAPLLSVGVQVDLPQSSAPQLPQSQDPLTVSLKADGRIFVQESEVALEDIGARLKAIAGVNPDVRIYVRADKQIKYGQVMEAMGILNEAGFSKVALVADSKTTAPSKK